MTIWSTRRLRGTQVHPAACKPQYHNIHPAPATSLQGWAYRFGASLPRASHSLGQTGFRLHSVVARRRIKHVLAPRFSITHRMLLPALGESNRDKHMGLMRWLVH